MGSLNWYSSVTVLEISGRLLKNLYNIYLHWNESDRRYVILLFLWKTDFICAMWVHSSEKNNNKWKKKCFITSIHKDINRNEISEKFKFNFQIITILLTVSCSASLNGAWLVRNYVFRICGTCSETQLSVASQLLLFIAPLIVLLPLIRCHVSSFIHSFRLKLMLQKTCSPTL